MQWSWYTASAHRFWFRDLLWLSNLLSFPSLELIEGKSTTVTCSLRSSKHKPHCDSIHKCEFQSVYRKAILSFYVGARINHNAQKSEETGEYCEDILSIWTEKTTSQVLWLSERHTHMIQLSRRPPAWRQCSYSADWVPEICASSHCASKSHSSHSQRCARCSGTAELSARWQFLQYSLYLNLERKLVNTVEHTILWPLYGERMALNVVYVLAYHQKNFWDWGRARCPFCSSRAALLFTSIKRGRWFTVWS